MIRYREDMGTGSYRSHVHLGLFICPVDFTTIDWSFTLDRINLISSHISKPLYSVSFCAARDKVLSGIRLYKKVVSPVHVEILPPRARYPDMCSGPPFHAFYTF